MSTKPDQAQAALQDAVAVTEWLQDEIGPAIRARLEKHKALVRGAVEAARAVAWDAPSTLWSSAPVDSEVWEGCGERVRAAVQAEHDRRARMERERVEAAYWAREAAARTAPLLSPSARLVSEMARPDEGAVTEYDPLAQ